MTPQKVKDYERLLKRPFPIQSVSFRKGPGQGKELAYITARDVMQRLDEVFGIDGWQDEYSWVGNRMICKLHCKFGSTWIAKSDGADDTSIEGAKGGISDSLKRASVKYGIFRYAYHPGAFNGRQPAKWATPEGYDEVMAQREGASVKEFKKALG
jgi:hypothetical protein